MDQNLVYTIHLYSYAYTTWAKCQHVYIQYYDDGVNTKTNVFKNKVNGFLRIVFVELPIHP